MATATAAEAQPPRTWSADLVVPLSPARIAGMPPDERPAWEEYWRKSEAALQRLPRRPEPDHSPTRLLAAAPTGAAHSRGLRLDAPDSWYSDEAARGMADRVAAAQLPGGGWTKGGDYTGAARPHTDGWGAATFDNDATTAELRFLARVISAGGAEPRAEVWRETFERGLGFLSDAQYPNGGFPQVYPLIGGYHDAITFNDDAMLHVLELLQDVAGGGDGFRFVTPPLRAAAARQVALGLRCVLAAQRCGPGNERTVWAQQCDPLTLRPCPARNFEPVADCARESALIVRWLMRLPTPSVEIVAAVDGAVNWFRRTALRDLKIARAPADLRGEALASPGAPPLWARMYEPGTATPIFGDRDRTIHYAIREISAERIAGYAWYTDAPRKVLVDYDRWRKAVIHDQPASPRRSK